MNSGYLHHPGNGEDLLLCFCLRGWQMMQGYEGDAQEGERREWHRQYALDGWIEK